MRLIFATHNKNKVLEVKSLISGVTELLSLGDVSVTEDIAETAGTLEGNALLKARYVYRKTAINCFADDSGLEVDALDGRPGVYSARYAGAQKSDADNMQKLLQELTGRSNRGAQFRTVIALILDGKEYVFEGLARGTITGEKRGSQGFGYDPLFVPEGYQSTFAELGTEVKNKISHRAIAVNKLVDFLQLQLTENKDAPTPGN